MSKIQKPTKSRSAKKSKTAILFQVRQCVDKTIQVGHSLNIISLKKNNMLKINYDHEESNFHKHNNYIDNTNSHVENNENTDMRSNHFGSNNPKKKDYVRGKSAKISIQLKSGSLLDQNYEKKYNCDAKYATADTLPSLHKVILKQQICSILDKLKRQRFISLDQQKKRISCSVENFTTIIGDYRQNITDLQANQAALISKIKKYETYFKQLKIKQNFEQSEQPDRNSQLKILNMERKIETLNYIIKNYRNNNKQEIKSFEKKINQFRPSLEDQLLAMLTKSNEKNQDLQDKIKYFESQCEKYYKSGNWVQIVRQLQSKDDIISSLQTKLTKIESDLSIAQENSKNMPILTKQISKLTAQKASLQQKNQHLTQNCKQISLLKLQKQQCCEQLLRKYQQLNYKYEGLLIVETKMAQKNEKINKNTLTIARLQQQKLSLMIKLESILKREGQKMYENQETRLMKIQRIEDEIRDLANRFYEQLQKNTLSSLTILQNNKNTDANNRVGPYAEQTGYGHQIASFYMHLYSKTKNTFESLIDEYRSKIKQVSLQKKQLSNILDNIAISSNKKSHQYAVMLQQVDKILKRRQKCVSMTRSLTHTTNNNANTNSTNYQQSDSTPINKRHIQNTQCNLCHNWMLNYGQLNQFFHQIYTLIVQHCQEKL